ncbi:hypothetical protein D3C73_869410 [compost metagenome]
MHVGAGRTTGGTGLGHFLASADEVADLHHQARIVRVAGDVAIAVIDVDHVAVTALDPGEADHAIGHGHHRVTDAGVEVHALVGGGTATERVSAGTEAGRDIAVADRHARGHGVLLQLVVEHQRFHYRQLAA